MKARTHDVLFMVGAVPIIAAWVLLVVWYDDPQTWVTWSTAGLLTLAFVFIVGSHKPLAATKPPVKVIVLASVHEVMKDEEEEGDDYD